MKLIEFDGVDFRIADEALLSRPVRELFRADRSRSKETFWRQISYLWFMVDPRSPYMYITDKEARSAEVMAQEGFEDGWKPSKTLQEAMEVYRKQTVTSSSILLEGMRKGIEQLNSFFTDFNLKEKDKNDRPIYQVSTMTGALKQIPELAKSLAEAEKALAADFASENKAKGSVTMAVGEDI